MQKKKFTMDAHHETTDLKSIAFYSHKYIYL